MAQHGSRELGEKASTSSSQKPCLAEGRYGRAKRRISIVRSRPQGPVAAALGADYKESLDEDAAYPTRPARNASTVRMTPRNSARPFKRPMKE